MSVNSATAGTGIAVVSGTATVTPAAIVIDANNTTAAVLAAGATFTGTATDISTYNQVNIEIYGTPSTAKASFYFEFSKDGTTWDVSVPALIRDPTFVIPIPVINVHKFFRVRYVNDGGVAAITGLGLPDSAGTPTLQTMFRLTTYLLPFATKELTRTLDQAIQGSDAVTLTRAVQMGRTPGNLYANTPQSGISQLNNTTATLGIGATFTGTFESCTGWSSLVIIITTDQISAVNGIEVDLSDNGVTIRRQIFKSYDSSDVSAGSEDFNVSIAGASYFRVRYTNGAVAQGTFFLRSYLSVIPLPADEVGLNDQLLDSTQSGVVRAQVFGKTAGVYSNVPIGTALGLAVDVNQFEAAAPLKALTSFATKQVVVGTSAVQLDLSPLANRKSIEVRAMNQNGTKLVYIGPNSGVATGNGRELVANEAFTMELDETVQVWAIATAAGQSVTVCEIGGTP